jgi:hypothetical protein
MGPYRVFVTSDGYGMAITISGLLVRTQSVLLSYPHVCRPAQRGASDSNVAQVSERPLVLCQHCVHGAYNKHVILTS